LHKEGFFNLLCGALVYTRTLEEYNEFRKQIKTAAKAESIKEFAERVDETLKRYSHLHKRAEKAMRSTEEYADGMPMEMVSVWEVLSLKKWEMADYENMTQLQDNIEDIAKARMLAEIEKDFRLLAKEMGVEL
jgi:DNA-binding ferritin-like protein